MRSIVALGLLMILCSSANAATAHRRHAVVRSSHGTIAADPASGFAYAPPPIRYQPAPNNDYNEPYLGASQGYAPGEYSRFLDSVRKGG